VSSDKEREIEKARFLFELALKSDEVLKQSYERLNEKIRGFFAIASTLVPIIVGLGYFVLKETKANWLSIPIFLSLILLLLAIAQGISLQEPSEFRFLQPLKVIKKFKQKPLRYIMNKCAVTWAKGVYYNNKVINSKENGLKRMLYLILASLTILAISFLILAIATLKGII